MKLLKIKNSSILILMIALIAIGCRRKSDDFYDDISIDSSIRPLVMVMAQSELAVSGDYAQPILKRINEGKVSGISAGSVNLLSLHPSVSDAEYNITSGAFKSLYDQNGDNTFQTYPSFISNGTNYSVDTNAFYQGIRDDLNTSPDAGVGIRLILENGVLSVYTKVRYFRDVSYDRHLGIYVYKKSSVHNQTTSDGQEPSHLVLNRLHASVTSGIGVKLNGSVSKDAEGKYLHQYTMNSEISTSNLGVMVVLYKSNDGKPGAVINSVTN